MDEEIPVHGQVAKRTISLTASWAFFAFSIVINSMGNVLTLVTSSHIHPQFLGSAYWTAAENNLGIAILGNRPTTLFLGLHGSGDVNLSLKRHPDA